MKQRFTLLLILSALFTAQGYAQRLEVTTHYEGENVIFDAELYECGSYTLVLNFLQLTGYRSPMGNPATTVVQPGYNSGVCRLQKDGDGPSSIRYTYKYYQGRNNAKPDKDFPYLLPLKVGEITLASELENIEATLGKTNVEKTIGIVFGYTGTDTVYAIRSGQVIDIKEKERDVQETEANAALFYNQSTNTIITVEHNDGTIAQYVCITSAKSLLEVNDRVIAGKPLAVFTHIDNHNRAGIRITYLTNLEKKILMPKFYTAAGLIQPEFGRKYLAASTPQILEKELTKKEKKKGGKGK